MSDSQIYTVEEIKKDIYKISEYTIANCFLVVGDEKALLIDCCTGIGDIKSVVRSITDKPIILVGTHAHIDHLGAAMQFGKVYVHKKEAFWSMFQSFKFVRRQFLKMHPLAKKYGVDYKHLPKQKPCLTVKPFSEGYEFDLGGKTVKSYLTPGHTNGSVCFKVENDNIVFVGDALIPGLYFIYDHAASLKAWKDAVSALLPLWDDCEIYGGHGRGVVKHEGIKWQLETAEKIISETQKNDSFKNRKNITVKNESDPHLVIAYRTDKVL